MIFPARKEVVHKGKRHIFPVDKPFDLKKQVKGETCAVLQIAWQVEKNSFPVKITVGHPNGAASAPPLISLLTVNQCIF